MKLTRKLKKRVEWGVRILNYYYYFDFITDTKIQARQEHLKYKTYLYISMIKCIVGNKVLFFANIYYLMCIVRCM